MPLHPSIHGSPANGGAGAESRLRTAVGAALSRRTGRDRTGFSAIQPMKPGLRATAICTVRQRALGSAAAPAGSFVFCWRGGEVVRFDRNRRGALGLRIRWKP